MRMQDNKTAPNSNPESKWSIGMSMSGVVSPSLHQGPGYKPPQVNRDDLISMSLGIGMAVVGLLPMVMEGDPDPSAQGAAQIGSVLQEEAAVGRTWPSDPSEMDRILGLDGEPIPDGPMSAGRGKVIWTPNENTRITFEQHPYHADAPEWHQGPHWHLDTPGQAHIRYLPGDRFP
jgi:hypothetical protein